eukprot:PhM_4_TR4232/c0_g2_i1/m.60876
MFASHTTCGGLLSLLLPSENLTLLSTVEKNTIIIFMSHETDAVGDDLAAAVVVIMGVSGCGKTTLAHSIVSKLSYATYIEADDHHPAENREKMRAGVALTDEDRWPWLDSLTAAAVRELTPEKTSGSHRVVVMTCSALRRIYRDRLRQGLRDGGVTCCFVYLDVSARPLSELLSRLGSRKEHFFNPALLQSQLRTLEPPSADERDVCVLAAHSDVVFLAEVSLLWLEVQSLVQNTTNPLPGVDVGCHVQRDGSVLLTQSTRIEHNDVMHEDWTDMPASSAGGEHGEVVEMRRSAESFRLIPVVLCGDKAAGKTTLCHTLCSGDPRVLQQLRYSHANFTNVWTAASVADVRGIRAETTSGRRALALFQSEVGSLTMTMDNGELCFFLDDEAYVETPNNLSTDAFAGAVPGHTMLRCLEVGGHTLDAMISCSEDGHADDAATARRAAAARGFLDVAKVVCYFVNTRGGGSTPEMVRRRLLFMLNQIGQRETCQIDVQVYLGAESTDDDVRRFQDGFDHSDGTMVRVFRATHFDPVSGTPNVQGALRILHNIVSAPSCLHTCGDTAAERSANVRLVAAAVCEKLLDAASDCRVPSPRCVLTRDSVIDAFGDHCHHCHHEDNRRGVDGQCATATQSRHDTVATHLHPLGGVPPIVLLDMYRGVAAGATQHPFHGVVCATPSGALPIVVDVGAGHIAVRGSEGEGDTVRLCGDARAAQFIRQRALRGVAAVPGGGSTACRDDDSDAQRRAVLSALQQDAIVAVHRRDGLSSLVLIEELGLFVRYCAESTKALSGEWDSVPSVRLDLSEEDRAWLSEVTADQIEFINVH